MGHNIRIKRHVLEFNFEAGTSRGVLNEHQAWFILIERDGVTGIGEASPLKGLSIDDVPHFEVKLQEVIGIVSSMGPLTSREAINELILNLGLEDYPAIAFGLETALLDLMNGGRRVIVENDFSRGMHGIPINGLIWMGEKMVMLQRASEKLTENFNCLKMKVGALSFETECEVLEHLREREGPDKLTLRVDANGAFTKEDVFDKLEMLSHYNLHSIEQPVAKGQKELMKEVCARGKVPVALDEELIGVNGFEQKRQLLQEIKPKFIVLKPTLLGGLQACREWIHAANSFEIGWWITSALESNIGLNAIAQFTYSRNIQTHQGLGTGQLYSNNIESPLKIENGYIVYDNKKSWNLDQLLND